MEPVSSEADLMLPTWRTLGAAALVYAALITAKVDPTLLHRLRGAGLTVLFVGTTLFIGAGARLWRRHRHGPSQLPARRGAQTSLVLGLVALLFPFTAPPLQEAVPGAITAAASPTTNANMPSATPTLPIGSSTVTTTPPPIPGVSNTPSEMTDPPSTSTSLPAVTASTYRPTTKAPSVTPTTPTSTPAPSRLSDHDVLVAYPDCVGGVCSLLARTDLVHDGARTTLALVRFPDDQGLGSRVGFLSVDAATREASPGISGNAYDIQTPTAAEIHIDAHGNIAAVTHSTQSYSLGELGLIGNGLETSEPFLSVSSPYPAPQSISFLPDDGNGYMRWEETTTSTEGGTTVATYGWGAYGFEATGCQLTRNGETVARQPSGSTC